MNHSPSSVLNEVIHLEQHKLGDEANEKYYHPIKFFNDYSAIYKHRNIEIPKEQEEWVTGKVDRKEMAEFMEIRSFASTKKNAEEAD